MSDAKASPVPSSNLPESRDRGVPVREMSVAVMEQFCEEVKDEAASNGVFGPWDSGLHPI